MLFLQRKIWGKGNGKETLHAISVIKIETSNHLFFECSVATSVWGIVGICLRSNHIPRSLAQYYRWITLILPHGESVYSVGAAAICWAIWKSRNRVCSDKKKLLHSPVEMAYLALVCSFLRYWSGLQKEEKQGRADEWCWTVDASGAEGLASFVDWCTGDADWRKTGWRRWYVIWSWTGCQKHNDAAWTELFWEEDLLCVFGILVV